MVKFNACILNNTCKNIISKNLNKFLEVFSMVKTYLTGALGFIFFGAGFFILTALTYLFPVTYGILDFPYQLYMSFFGITQTVSGLTTILYAIWTSLWILLMGIGCISAREQTKVALVPIIIGAIGIFFIMFSAFILAGHNQAFKDAFNTLFIVGLMEFGSISLPFQSIAYGLVVAAAFTPLITAAGFVTSLIMILDLINALIIALFFIFVACSFITVDNRGYGDSYKILTGFFIIIYASIQIILALLPHIIGVITTGSAMSTLGVIFGTFGVIEAVLFYLLPIFGVMMFVLINIDNPD